MALNGLLQRLSKIFRGRTPKPPYDWEVRTPKTLGTPPPQSTRSVSYYSIIIILIITATRITKLTDLSTIVNDISSSLSFSSK